MNVEKSELKMILTKEIGQRIRDQEEAAIKDLSRNEGAMGSLKQACEKLEVHKDYYKRELMEEKMTPEEHKIAVTAIDQCKGILTNLHDAAFINKQIKQGELLAFGRASDLLSQMHETERSKLEDLYRAIEDGTIIPEEDGSIRSSLQTARSRSVVDDLNERRAQAQANKEKKDAKSPVNISGTKKATAKKRGRPRKKSE